MRVPDIGARRPTQRSRAWIVAAGVVVFALLSLQGVARFYTDYLWFREVEMGGVWRGILFAKTVPVVIFVLVFFVLAYLNLWIADRVAPSFHHPGLKDDLVDQYHELVGPYQGKVRLGVAALMALIAGGATGTRWRDWILFTNKVDFGIEDPQFHVDIGFYVFQLPYLKFVVSWVFSLLVMILILTALAHYLNGGIRVQGSGARVTPQVKVHLSVLLALMAVVKTVDYFLQRFELNFSARGVVNGASATDVKAQLPALHMLMVIAVLAAVLFLVNIRLRGWTLPAIAVGLWGIVWVVISGIFPTAYQRFAVEPNEAEREKPYIERNINATKAAFGIDTVETVSYPYGEALTATDVSADIGAIDNARVWDPEQLLGTFAQLQEIRPFYRFKDVDLDRYVIDGMTEQVAVSVREINPARLPNKSWQSRHLFYTHGQGLVVSPATVASSDGRPLFFLRDIPTKGTEALPLTQSAIYYGEHGDDYAIVKTRQKEFDYPREGESDKTSEYSGRGGVKLSNMARRIAFALRFGDLNPLVSGQITSRSRALFVRNVADRVRKAAPFLRFDANPYPVATGGRVVWVIDGYTASDRYPYSQAFQPASGRLPRGSDLNSRFNYVRNSVKATVDAYDGTLTFYVVDTSDPIIRSYRKAFPKMFTDIKKMPADLQTHLRYPDDIFRVQTDVFATYHVTTAQARLRQSDEWAVSPDPETGGIELDSRSSARDVTTTTLAGSRVIRDSVERMKPYYLLMDLPGKDKEQFVIAQPFVPVSGDNKLTNLLAFMVASWDPVKGPVKEVFVMPRGKQVYGPPQVDAQIQNTPDIAERLTLLNQSGSEVIQGTLQVIPVKDSILYVRPIYVQSSRGGLPEPRFMAVFYAGRAAMASSLEAALAQLFSGLSGVTPTQPPAPGAPAVTPTPGGDASPTEGDIGTLVADLAKAYEEAQAALRGGDLAGYQRAVDRMGELIRSLEAVG